MLSIWPRTTMWLPGFSSALHLLTMLLDGARRRCRDRDPARWHRRRRPAECWNDCRPTATARRCMLRDVAEHVRYRRACRRRAAGDRRVVELVVVGDAIFRRLHGEVIGNAILRIGPEIGRDLLRRAEADVEIVGDAAERQPELLRARAVDGVVELGASSSCCTCASTMPGTSAMRCCSSCGDRVVARAITPLDLHVDLRSARRSSAPASPCRRAGNRRARRERRPRSSARSFLSSPRSARGLARARSGSTPSLTPIVVPSVKARL